MINKTHKYIECDCTQEMLRIDYDDEDEYKLFYISVYKVDLGHPWRFRLGHIWRIITKGYPYSDEIVLSPEKAKELAKYIMDKV